MEMEAEAEVSSASIVPKKTEIASPEAVMMALELPLPHVEGDDRLLVASPLKTVPSAFSSGDFSRNDVVKSADLNATSFETEVSTCKNNSNFRFSSKKAIKSPLSQTCGDSENQTTMGTSSKKASDEPRLSKPLSSAEKNKMPSAAEIDEFFTEAEKQQLKRFSDKYNYDFVKDAPLEGRYEWVSLNETQK